MRVLITVTLTIVGFTALTWNCCMAEDETLPSVCATKTHTVDLNQNHQSQHRNIEYTARATSLILVCSGTYYTNITWRTVGSLSGLSLTYTQTQGELVLSVECGKVNTCSRVVVTCSGTRLSDSQEREISITFSPRCNINTESSTETYNSTAKTGSLKLMREQSDFAGPLPYFGIILGFSICVGLAAISCLVVFLQRQLNNGELHRVCGGRCVGRYLGSDSYNDIESPREKSGAQLPIMKLARRQKRNRNQSKLGTVHEM